MGFWSYFLGTDPDRASAPIGGGAAGQRSPGVGAYTVLDLKNDAQFLDLLNTGEGVFGAGAVSESAAMRNATFARVVTLSSGVIGMLPLSLFERLEDGRIEKRNDHWAWDLVRDQPNPAQTPFEFKSFMQGRALLYGDAFALKVKGARPGTVSRLIPLDPRRMEVKWDERFELTYRYRRESGGAVEYSPNEIFHLRGPWSRDGVRGKGFLELASDVLRLANTADLAARKLFENGAYVGGVLEHPKTLSPEAIKHLREQFSEKFEGASNRGRWIIAEEGMKAHPLGTSGREAEGLAQRRFQAEEIARITGIPRPLLMFDETSWGSGIEQLGVFLVTYYLLPWFKAWEEALSRALLTSAERKRLYFKFNEAALMRGSLKDQAEFFSKAIGGPGAGGFMTPNEAREKMEMNPEEWGDEPAWKESSGGSDS